MHIQKFFDQAKSDLFSSLKDSGNQLALKVQSKSVGTDAVFLAGGGEDSAAALHHFCANVAQRRDNDKLGVNRINIYPIYMDYGQLAADIEIACIHKQCEVLEKYFNGPRGYDAGVFKFHPLHVLTDPLKDLIINSKSLLTGGDQSAYIEYRNLRYLTTAAAFASLKKASWIIAGLAPAVMSVDSGYAANVSTQLALNQNVLNEGSRVRIYAPIILVHRSACARYLAEEAGESRVELYTFSCYTPTIDETEQTRKYTPCGTCLSCQVRIGGHRLGGYPDISSILVGKDGSIIGVNT